MAQKDLISPAELFRLVLAPERRFYTLLLLYGIAISTLTLSVPLSVQVLIGTVVNTALVQQVVVLSLILFGLLALSGLFSASQNYLMELFERRFFARIVSDTVLRLLYARPDFMQRINRDELVNRYFDIMTVQKNLPTLLTGALATALQTLVGIAVTSAYHPVFLAFNCAVVLIGYLVFRVFDRGALTTAIALSDSKYAIAQWLESLARSNLFFKSSRTAKYALDNTQDIRDRYIVEHKKHFRYTFAQIIGYLVLYAVFSAALLGIGGWLTILGELTIGQLVAAELIFSAIFYGFSRIGYYLELYYDLYAAMYKLVQLLGIEEQPRNILDDKTVDSAAVRFHGVKVPLDTGDFDINFETASGHLCLIATRSGKQIQTMTDLLLSYKIAISGEVSLGGVAVSQFPLRQLHDLVHVVDATVVPELSIANYLKIAAPDISHLEMLALLDVVGLRSDLPTVQDSLNQPLTSHGYPLSPTGIVKLKIAFALAYQPRLLVLTPLFDALSHESRTSIVSYVRERTSMTLLCFSHRRDLNLFDEYWLCDFDRQKKFDSLDQFERSESLAGQQRAGIAGEDER